MNKAITYTIYFLIASSFILKAPSIMDNMKAEGKIIEPNKLYQYNSVTDISPVIFPAPRKKSIAIFWASWCIPCKIELERISDAISEKKIDPSAIIAISLDEDLTALDKFLKDKKYLFKIYLDKENNFLTKLNIVSTPTLILIDEKNTIRLQTTGVSINLIGKLTTFLEENKI